MNCLLEKFPDISHFFKLHDSSVGRHVNAASRKSLEIQACSITKPRTSFEVKICMKISFQLL